MTGERKLVDITRNVGGAALAAEDLTAHPAVVAPSEGGELGGALVTLQGDVVRHPVLSQVALRPASSGQQAGQLGEDVLTVARLHPLSGAELTSPQFWNGLKLE